MRINHNVPGLAANNSSAAAQANLAKAVQKLSSGLRVNSAADDSAAFSVSEKMRAQVRGLDMAVRDSQDGISMIQTAEGALGTIHSILQRMRELSLQAANDTLTRQDRAYIQSELDELRGEIDRVGNTSRFNEKVLLDGSSSALWSSGDLETVAVINGGLRRTGRGGQKISGEGNYRISIQAKPGQAQALKTNAFTLAGPEDPGAFAQVIGSVNKTYSTAATQIVTITAPKTFDLGASGLDELRAGKLMSSVRHKSYDIVNAQSGTVWLNYKLASGYEDLVIQDLRVSLKQDASVYPKPYNKPIKFVSVSGWYTRADGSAGEITGSDDKFVYTFPNGEVNSSTTSNPVEKYKNVTLKTDSGKEIKVNMALWGNRWGDSCRPDSDHIFGWNSVALDEDAVTDKIYFKVGATQYNVSVNALANKTVTFKDLISGASPVTVDFSEWTADDIVNTAIAADNGGTYTKDATTTTAVTVTETAEVTYVASYGDAGSNISVADMYKGNGSAFDAALIKSMFDASGLKGVNLALSAEVVSGGASPTLAITGRGLDVHGGEVKIASPVSVTLDGTPQKISVDVGGATQELLVNLSAVSGAFQQGDKFSAVLSDGADATQGVTVTGSDGTSAVWNFNSESVRGKTLELLHYVYDPNNGDLLGGGAGLVISVPDPSDPDLSAPESAALRSVRQFAEAGIASGPKTLTVTQGDGRRTSFTLDAGDTIGSMVRKLNDAIGAGLGQSKYLTKNFKNAASNFARFVSGPVPYTALAAEGTVVISSAVAGLNGRLSFSGDENIIKALGLNVIRESGESDFSVTVEDAHSGLTKARTRVTGNRLDGAVDRNVDVIFSAMADTAAEYDERAGLFELTSKGGAVTYLHLADNTTVLQVGANEGEVMEINIGDMRSLAMGLYEVSAADRESAARSVTVIDGAMDRVSKQRAMLGAYRKRLNHAIGKLTVAGENLTAARGRIRGADMAKEIVRYAKLNILLQSSNAMSTQANQFSEAILVLLE